MWKRSTTLTWHEETHSLCRCTCRRWVVKIKSSKETVHGVEFTDTWRETVERSSRRRPAERLHEKASVVPPFGTGGTISIFCCFAPAVLCAPIWKTKNLLKTPCLPSVFLMFSMRVFFFREGFWSFADVIRKWSRANPVFVFGCI